MGLRCLLGHDFGEPEVEREREEDGNEVVVTVREVKTCDRCGDRRVVSENKEVTSLDQLAGDPAPDLADAEAAARDDAPAGESTDAPTGPSGPGVDPTGAAADVGTTDDAEFIDADDSPADADPAVTDADAADADVEATEDDRTDAGPDAAEIIEEPEADPAGDADPAPEPDAAADARTDVADAPEPAEGATEEDDGVILDEDGTAESADRGRGEWPDADDAGRPEPGEAAPWPDQEGADEGFDAEPGGGAPDGVTFGGGLAPEDDADVDPADVDPGDGGETVEASAAETAEPEATPPEEDAGSGITRAESVTLDTGDRQSDTEFYCPECGHAKPSLGSSMRAGDICPECRRGYITEREL